MLAYTFQPTVYPGSCEEIKDELKRWGLVWSASMPRVRGMS